MQLFIAITLITLNYSITYMLLGHLANSSEINTYLDDRREWKSGLKVGNATLDRHYECPVFLKRPNSKTKLQREGASFSSLQAQWLCI